MESRLQAGARVLFFSARDRLGTIQERLTAWERREAALVGR
jgi:hypothetical protein